MRIEMSEEQIRCITPCFSGGFVNEAEFFTKDFDTWCKDQGITPEYDVNISYGTEMRYTEDRTYIPSNANRFGVREAFNEHTKRFAYFWFEDKWYIDVPLYDADLVHFVLRWGGKINK